MKKIIYTLLILLPLSLNAQWEIINEGFKNGYFWSQLSTVDFVNEDVGWIGGNNGNLVKTTDGGETWNSSNIPDSISFKHLCFITESIGWAVCGNWGEGGSVWKSSDGGFSWIIKSPDYDFTTLVTIDENNMYAIGGDTIFKTTNGGINWIDISPNIPDRNYNSLWFQNPQIGVVVGNYNDGTTDRGVILKTTNGGTDWSETIVNEFNSIYDLQYLDSNNGYFRAILDTTHFICKTENLCASWVIKTINPYSISSYQFLDNNIVSAIMGDSISSNNVMRSVDGGLTWSKIYTPKEGLSINKIYFNTTNNGIITANILGPVLLNSSDGGFNWEIQKFSYLSCTDISFIDYDKGIIVGGYCLGLTHCSSVGHIFSTTNGGKTWNITNSVDRILQTSIFVNDFVGYCLGDARQADSKLYKTTDSGNNWTQVNSIQGNDICFIDEQNGFAVGRYEDSLSNGAGIFNTTNGGESWGICWQFPDSNNYIYSLKSIHFNNSTGWSVGEGGMIAKYTPQTGWVKKYSVTTLPLNKVFFADDDHGWIAGGYQNENDFQTILLKTNNAGSNWNIVPNVPYLLRDISFIDSSIGWAIGYTQSGNGGILKTTDGGISWVAEAGNFPAQLNSLFIKDNYAWAVGDNGLILRNTDAGVVWVEEENNNVYPTEFGLVQNYPNPFNPKTIISYQLPVISKVTLKVYDLLGKEVAVLVNEEQSAGVYDIEFGSESSIKKLASGIYFYQLKAGEYIATKKMVLLK